MRWTAKDLRRAERELRKENPWFGKRRKTSMEGDRKKKRDKEACRKGNWDG